MQEGYLRFCSCVGLAVPPMQRDHIGKSELDDFVGWRGRGYVGLLTESCQQGTATVPFKVGWKCM